MGSHYFLQGIFLTQGSNVGLLYFRQFLYRLSHVCVLSLNKDVFATCDLGLPD